MAKATYRRRSLCGFIIPGVRAAHNGGEHGNKWQRWQNQEAQSSHLEWNTGRKSKLEVGKAFYSQSQSQRHTSSSKVTPLKLLQTPGNRSHSNHHRRSRSITYGRSSMATQRSVHSCFSYMPTSFTTVPQCSVPGQFQSKPQLPFNL